MNDVKLNIITEDDDVLHLYKIDKRDFNLKLGERYTIRPKNRKSVTYQVIDIRYIAYQDIEYPFIDYDEVIVTVKKVV